MSARSDQRTTTNETAPGQAVSPAAGKNDQAKKSNNDRWDDDEEPWRHPPVAPNDESPAESLGRSVSDVVIGPSDAAKDKPKP